MQRNAPETNAVANASKSAAAEYSLKSLSEMQAAEIMWLYYRDRKAQLIADIKEYRSSILSELMRGDPVEQVFLPYFRPPEPPTRARRAR
jgi:hypothetical protein